MLWLLWPYTLAMVPSFRRTGIELHLTLLLQVDQLGMVGVNGTKFPAIRQHLQEKIAGVYADMDVS